MNEQYSNRNPYSDTRGLSQAADASQRGHYRPQQNEDYALDHAYDYPGRHDNQGGGNRGDYGHSDERDYGPISHRYADHENWREQNEWNRQNESGASRWRKDAGNQYNQYETDRRPYQGGQGGYGGDMQGNWASDIDQRPQYGRDNQTGNASGMDTNRDSRYSTSHGSHHAFAFANHPYQPGQTQSGGRAPKGYSRSDKRIREDICERLMSHPYADASEVTISVKEGLVTLEGKVVDRPIKYEIENVAESCLGVKDVENRIRVDAQSAQSGSPREAQASPQSRPGKRESA